MAGFNHEYLKEHKVFRHRSAKAWFVFPLLAVVVAIVVFWYLKLVGITVTSEAFCGQDAHEHDEDCYTMEALDDGGYEQVLICHKIAHTHTSECFSVKSDDTETAKQWKRSFEHIPLTNDVHENLLSIAFSQIGYAESATNFEYNDAGIKQGYTRYGEWYGNPYGEWNTMFVSFCLDYANANNADDLMKASAESARLAWQGKGKYASADSYDGGRGDVVFFDTNADGKADRVGILAHKSENWLHAIEGDVDGRVAMVNYDSIPTILGYGKTSELYAANHLPQADEGAAEQTATEPATGTVNNYVPKDNGTQQILNRRSLLKATRSSDIVYTNQLADELVEAVIKTMDGQLVEDGGTIYLGESYMVALEFSEINTGSQWVQFKHEEGDYLYYQIPSNLNVVPFTDWHPITAKTENGTIENVGRYFIDENGLLKVEFFEMANGQNFLMNYSNVDFTIDFNTKFTASQDGSSSEIIFSNDVQVNLGVDGDAFGTVEKDAGKYDGDTHTVEYTVRFEVTHGKVSTVTFNDDVWEKHQVLRDSIVIVDLNGVPFDPQPTIVDNAKGAAGGFTVEGLPDMSAGEGFLVTYKATLNDDQLHNQEVNLWNYAEVLGKNQNGEDEWFADDAYPKIEMERLNKNGKQVILDNGVKVIEWKVVVKKTTEHVNEGIVIDTLGEGLEYYTDKPIYIKVLGLGDNEAHDTYLSWDDVTINGNSIEFQLPQGYAYEIVYYTTYEQLEEGDTKQYFNNIHITLNGHNHHTEGSANVVAFTPNVDKTASGEDGKYVNFTIKSDVSAGIKDWGHFYITDSAAFWTPYLYVENFPEEMEVKILTKSGQTIVLTPYVEGGPIENTYILKSPSDGGEHHTFKIYFNTDTPSNASSKWILDEDGTLIITYKIPTSAKTGTEWSGQLTGDQTVMDLLLDGYQLVNDAWINFCEGISTNDVAQYEYQPKIHKAGTVADGGVIDYEVLFNNTIPGSSGDSGYINGTTNDVYFTDTFDERLEYVPGSLQVTAYSPYNDKPWLAKFRYNGTITGNEIRIKADEFLYETYNTGLPDVAWIANAAHFQDFYLWWNRGGQFVFTYQLRVKDEYLDTVELSTLTLNNVAELTWGENGTSGPASDTVEYRTGLLDKSMVQRDDELDFTIHVNLNALDVMPDADTLTVLDKMKDNMSLYWRSIKLTYEDENGNMVDFNSEESQYTYTVTFNPATNEITFVIPDSLHVRIDYTTLITESGHVNVHNSVDIVGKSGISDSTDAYFDVMEHSGDASGSNHSILMLKQDAVDDHPLPGAEFVLYGPMGDTHATPPDGVAQSILTREDKELFYIGTYTTGEQGTAVIETQYLTAGGPYALVERTAPEGYEVLPNPVYFYFFDPDPAGEIQTVTTMVVVENAQWNIIIPETGGPGHLPMAIIGITLMAFPILYVSIRRRRERRFERIS